MDDITGVVVLFVVGDESHVTVGATVFSDENRICVLGTVTVVVVVVVSEVSGSKFKRHVGQLNERISHSSIHIR